MSGKIDQQKMTDQELFKRVYDQVLDYTDDELISRCAEWGYEVYKLLKENNRLLVYVGAENEPIFIYAITTAIIIGKFSKIAFNDHHPLDENELDLDLFGVGFGEVFGILNESIDAARREKLQLGNYCDLRDISESVYEYRQEIHKSLAEIYKKQGEKEPDYKIYTSLLKIFEMKNEETGEMFLPQMNSFSVSPEQEGYSYVSNGFQ